MAEDRERVVETLIDDDGTVTFRREDGSILWQGQEGGSGGDDGGGFVEGNGQYLAKAPDGTTMVLQASDDGKGIQIHSGFEMLDITSQKGIGLSSWGADPIFLRADDMAGNQSFFQVGPNHVILSMRDEGRFEITDSDGAVIGGIYEDGTTTGVFVPKVRGGSALPDLWFPLWAYGGLTTQNIAPGVVRISRTVFAVSVKAVQLNLATAVASTAVRLCVYADNNGLPGALLYQSADIPTITAGNITVPIGPIPAGTYWFGLQNISAAGSPTFRSPLGANPYMSGMDAPGNNLPNCWANSGQGNTLKDPFPLTGVTRNDPAPTMWLQAV